jgi:hypothetical protein
LVVSTSRDQASLSERSIPPGGQRGPSRRVARASRLHISDYRLPAIIDVDVLDADILVSAVTEAAKGLDARNRPASVEPRPLRVPLLGALSHRPPRNLARTDIAAACVQAICALVNPDGKAAADTGADKIKIDEQLLKTKTNRPISQHERSSVTENQDLIERVADALFEAETQVLSGDQVRALKRS